MDVPFLSICLLSLISFVAGFVDSIAGGGGLLTIPSLLFAGVPPQFALGTNKLSGCLGTAVAVMSFAKKKLMWWPLVGVGIGFTLAGGALGSQSILALDDKVISALILVLLPLATLSMFWKRKGSVPAEHVPELKPLILKTIMLCFSIGFYDGFFGPGTGTFLALGFHLFLHLDLLRATAHAKIFNLISNLGSLIVFLVRGKVLFNIAIPMAISSMAGNYIGSHFAMKKGDAFIRLIYLGVLLLLFVTLAFKILQNET